MQGREVVIQSVMNIIEGTANDGNRADGYTTVFTNISKLYINFQAAIDWCEGIISEIFYKVTQNPQPKILDVIESALPKYCPLIDEISFHVKRINMDLVCLTVYHTFAYYFRALAKIGEVKEMNIRWTCLEDLRRDFIK
jgi:hypothetical protein